MKNLLPLFAVITISCCMGSCGAIEGIFKAGMGVGIFLVLAVVVVIGLVIARAGKK